jgi:hypothetical protein
VPLAGRHTLVVVGAGTAISLAMHCYGPQPPLSKLHSAARKETRKKTR